MVHIGADYPCRKALVIGDQEVARRTSVALRRQGVSVQHLLHPTDDELRVAMRVDIDAVAVLVHSDVIALRYALLVEHVTSGMRMIVTVFDRTVADQLVHAIPNCCVSSPADTSVPSIAGACLGPEVLAVRSTSTGATLILQAEEHGEVQRLEWATASSDAQSRLLALR